MSRTLHLFGTDWGAMMVPIHALQWYRFADTVKNSDPRLAKYIRAVTRFQKSCPSSLTLRNQ